MRILAREPGLSGFFRVFCFLFNDPVVSLSILLPLFDQLDFVRQVADHAEKLETSHRLATGPSGAYLRE